LPAHLSKDGLRAEIIACGRDPAYFIRKYVKIRHPVRGLIPFDLFNYQVQLLQDYREHRENVILKARQLGISEITASYVAWLIMFHRDKSVVVMATKADTAKNIIKKVKTALDKLPPWLVLAEPVTDNKLSIELSNGSFVKAIAKSQDAGRSEALSLLIIDEAAFVPGFDELWTGLAPTIQAGGSVIILSTPNGVGNKFHQIFVEAEAGTNNFHPTTLMWWRHPEHVNGLEDDPDRPGFKTSPWFRGEIKRDNMSPRDVAQELECNFLSSGDTVIGAAGLTWIDRCVLDPMAREHFDRNLYIWARAQAGKQYLETVDVARGDGRDFSAVHVFDVSSMEQVAEYKGKVPVDELARLSVDLGRQYNRALLVIENNAIGMACIEHVKLLFYENLYYSRKGDQRPGEAINALWSVISDDLVPGFTMSPKNRPLIIAKLEEYIRNHSIIFRSRRTLDEARTFIWNNGRAEAMRGYNDDLMMSAAAAAWMRDTFMNPTFVTTDVKKKLLEATSVDRVMHTQIEGVAKDPRFGQQSQLKPFRQRHHDMKIRLPHGEVEDFSWLLK
jgi:hypothetical protein